MEKRKRAYRLGKRAERQEQTRRRIVEAAAQLHEEIGPAATTFSAIAERARVQRLTLYRHFPDEAAIFAACSAHVGAQHPPPDPSRWQGIPDAAGRLDAALRALYGYYRQRERSLTLVLRDAERLPALREALGPMQRYLEAVADDLASGWSVERGRERDFHAALRHALDFWTWRSLAARGLGPGEAAGLMARFVAVAGRG